MLPIRWLCERSRAKRSLAAWKVLEKKHFALPIGYENFDEAVTGLRSITDVPEDEIVPRLPAPGTNRFTRRRFVRHPEFERDRARFFNWLLDFFVLAYSIPRDWIVRPFYNDVFAPLVDRFVLTRLWKRAHGTDLLGARIVAVTHTPQPPPTTPVVPNCSNVSSRSLVQSRREVRSALSRYLERLRSRIGLNASAAVRILHLVTAAMGSPNRQGKLLLHTTYFRQVNSATGSFASEVADCLLGNTETYQAPVPAIPLQPVRRRRCDDVQYRFLAALTRAVVVALLVASPAIAGWGAARLFMYDDSRDHLVEDTRGLMPQVRKPMSSNDIANIPTHFVWVNYLTALPPEDAIGSLVEENGGANALTASVWRMHYAAALATKKPSLFQVAWRILKEESDRIGDAGTDQRELGIHLIGATRYLSEHFRDQKDVETAERLDTLIKDVGSKISSPLPEEELEKKVKEYRFVNTRKPTFIGEEKLAMRLIDRQLRNRQYADCRDTFKSMPDAGNGQLSFATQFLNSNQSSMRQNERSK